MILVVDIGNTNINNGIFKGKTLQKSFSIPTHRKGLKARYTKKLKRVDRAVIVSVVPKALREVEGALRGIVDGKISIVGRNAQAGIKNRYRNPKQVGQDRLVNARAAYELYGGASIIVDFGTAITIDVVNKKREYMGGVIAPGVEISLNALSKRTVLLPMLTLKKPRDILGKETRESMRSGVVYGFASLCDGVVERLKKKIGIKVHVVATGGLSPLIGPYCKSVDKIDPDLTLKGLELVGRDDV